MSAEEKKIKKITLGIVLSWIFGAIFLISGFNFLFSGVIIGGVALIFASIILFPPTDKFIKEKWKFQISGGLKIVLVIILFIIYAASLATSNYNHPNNNLQTGQNLNKNINAQTEIKEYHLGDEVSVGDFKWKIIDMTTATELGDDIMGNFYGQKADGIFVIFDVEVENIGSSAEYLTDSYVKIIDDQNREFSPDSTAAFYLKPEGSALVFDQINPGITKKGKIVYDVPENLKGYLEISSNNIWSSDKAYVSWK